jgi:hypothetical protein
VHGVLAHTQGGLGHLGLIALWVVAVVVVGVGADWVGGGPCVPATGGREKVRARADCDGNRYPETHVAPLSQP